MLLHHFNKRQKIRDIVVLVLGKEKNTADIPARHDLVQVIHMVAAEHHKVVASTILMDFLFDTSQTRSKTTSAGHDVQC
ncbi:hypothetical protein [Parasitella parasitica]|uniref:Uncharacterized protein n=1 Tax=Parasitella parasitica TaxID=35722 RepID=A0A0B7NHL2_9FUNG|nr:hypothetical protein [Parasitella parasitica]